MKGLQQPADIEGHEIHVSDLRKRLLQSPELARPINITVRGTLYPCALMSPGWWERPDRFKECEPKWNDNLQKWLFYGFDLWGPSWDFCWDFESAQSEAADYYIAQLGDGDEANSLPVIIPPEKAKRLRHAFMDSWGGLEVKVKGLLGHRRQFSQEPSKINLIGGLLDYCIWQKEDDENQKTTIMIDRTEIYSGYLWKCLSPKKWIDNNKTLTLDRVYFVWEHTNFCDREAIKYNLDSLDHKEKYIRKAYGDLVLLQKSSSLVPGQAEWPTQKFHDLLLGKSGVDI